MDKIASNSNLIFAGSAGFSLSGSRITRYTISSSSTCVGVCPPSLQFYTVYMTVHLLMLHE